MAAGRREPARRHRARQGLPLICLAQGLRRLDAREEMMQQSEPARYRQRYVALNSGGPKTAYPALEAWTKSMAFRSIARWVAASGDRDVQNSMSRFERDVFGSSNSDAASGHMTDLASAALVWRGSKAARVRQADAREPALPPLNPGIVTS